MKKPTISVAIADSDDQTRNLIQVILEEHFPEIELTSESNCFREALINISRCQPQILFLGVEIEGGCSFDLIETLSLPFKTVFLSHDEQHAIRALRHKASDYLLKPLQPHEFISVVERLMCQIEQNRSAHQRNNLVPKIAVPSLKGLNFISTEEILYAEADSNYTILHHKGGKEVVSRTLGQFEEELNDFGFLRVHHKYLINLRYIQNYERGKGGGYVILCNRSEIPVSVRKKSELFRLFSLQE